ncbi:MAG: hypothetical protein GY875_13230 [Gammaproteobacteria bacterium]|nr:hypothetical protein [Gammaproteobacteria bacterium]
MKRIIGLLGLISILLYPVVSHSEAAYVDLIYEDSLSVLPKDSSWIKKLFSDQQRKVFLVVSISKRNSGDTNEVLLLPPRIVESFERSDGELKRTKSDNLDLLTSQFVNDSEQLLLKVEFFSVKNSSANAFSESLKSLATAYVAAGATPAASKVVTSAMDAIGSVLFDNKEIYLNYIGGVSTANDSSAISLYFDDSGNINDSVFDGADASKKVVFQVYSTTEFSVDFKYSFENQGVNQIEKITFEKLSAARSPSDKRDACRALRTALRKRFSDSTTNDLIAIAVNDINWPQDETQYSCMDPTEAVKYKREHGLTYIANCTSDECTKTKTALILLDGNASVELISSITGSDIYSLDCKSSTQFSKLFRWSNINNTYENQGFKSFEAKSCLTIAGDNYPYSHTFSWLNGALASHSCDQTNEDNYCN